MRTRSRSFKKHIQNENRLFVTCIVIMPLYSDIFNISVYTAFHICVYLAHEAFRIHIPGAPPPPQKKMEQSISQDFALINSYLFHLAG